MSAWTDRLALARQGWKTEIRLDRSRSSKHPENTASAGIWAKTFFWSGGISEVCLHDHALIGLSDPQAHACLDTLAARLREACERARRDFIDNVPCLGHPPRQDGRLVLVENTHETRRLLGSQREFFPTENLPEDISRLGDADPPGMTGALIAAADRGLYVEDGLDPYYGRLRYVQDCKDRDWGYRLRLAKRAFRGKKVVFQPQEITSRILSEEFLAGLIRHSAASLDQLFEKHGPGGAQYRRDGSGLPPGYRHLADTLSAVPGPDGDPEP